MRIIGLLDLDGVLIKPGGYRAAFHATLANLLKQLGLENQIPGKDIPLLFEALGVSNEWDMVTICLLIALEFIGENHKDTHIYDNYEEMVGWCQKLSPMTKKIDYYSHISSLSGYLCEIGFSPSESLSNAINRDNGVNVFPWLSQQPILIQLLRDINTVLENPATRLFQNYVLGEQEFEKIYKRKAVIHGESYLRLYDTSLLSISSQKRLRTLIEERKMSPVIYTARNSYPSFKVHDLSDKYSPEAEIALELVGLNTLPIVSTGSLTYVAEMLNRPLSHFLKPSPVQALAAIALAGQGQDLEALTWAVKIYDQYIEHANNHVSNIDIMLPKELRKIELHIFEDSPNGIRAGKSAVDILMSHGADVNLYLWGIAENREKTEVLEKNGAIVFNNINQALIRAFGDL